MNEFVGKVDEKGRVIIPSKLRSERKISPKDEVVFKIKEIRYRKNFVELCEGCLEGVSGDPVKLMHTAFSKK